MPYVGVVKTDRLVLPSNPDYWVEMKARPTYGDRQAAQKAMLRVSQVDLASVPPEKMASVEADPESGRGVLTEIEVNAFFETYLTHLITDWNLDLANGERLPITTASLALLDDQDGDFLMAQARLRLAKRPRVVEGPFDGRSQPQ